MSSKKKLSLREVGQIAITVQNIDRAIEFYRDILDLPFLFRAQNMGFFQCGSIRLMLAVPEKEELNHPASILYYKTDDIQSACEVLNERGVALESGPHLVHKADDHDLWMAFFRDSEGNLLALMSEIRL